MKKWVMVLCAWMLMLCAACAQANEWGTLFEPPQEVLEHIQSRWADHELEDYCEVQGTSKGDYGFALLHKQSERILVGYHKENGRMKYWLKNAGAVPQGKEKASFYVGEAGWKDELDQYENPTGKKVYDDGLYFGLHMLDEIGESYQYGVAYRWQDGMFRLFAYYKGAMDSVTVTDDGLNFFEYANGEQGYVKGKVQRDIRYVSFNALPTWIDDAKAKLTVAPNSPAGRNIRFIWAPARTMCAAATARDSSARTAGLRSMGRRTAISSFNTASTAAITALAGLTGMPCPKERACRGWTLRAFRRIRFPKSRRIPS